MTTDTDDPTVYETDPDFRAAPWRPVPSDLEQAKEAARDDPTLEEFVGLLLAIPDVGVGVWYDDEPWCETMVMVSHIDSTYVSDALTIARRAGWELEGVTFERDRLEFVRRGERA